MVCGNHLNLTRDHRYLFDICTLFVATSESCGSQHHTLCICPTLPRDRMPVVPHITPIDIASLNYFLVNCQSKISRLIEAEITNGNYFEFLDRGKLCHDHLAVYEKLSFDLFCACNHVSVATAKQKRLSADKQLSLHSSRPVTSILILRLVASLSFLIFIPFHLLLCLNKYIFSGLSLSAL